MPDSSPPFATRLVADPSRNATCDSCNGSATSSKWSEVLLAMEQMLDAEEASTVTRGEERGAGAMNSLD